MKSFLQRRFSQVAETWVPTTLLGISLLVNGYFMWQRQMPTRAARDPQINVGTQVTPVQATSLGGEPITVGWGGDSRSTVLYVLRPDCPWCKRNFENIRTIAKARQTDYRFVGLSLTRDQLDQSLADMPLPFPVYVVDPSSVAALHLGATPETLVIGPDGRVKNVWIGAYAEPLQKEVETAFNVALPGLSYAGSTQR